MGALFPMMNAEAEYFGRVVGVECLAAEIGIQPGDELLGINGHSLRDVIDVQFYAAEPWIEFLVRRDDELWLFEAERDDDHPMGLGLSFAHPTFDTDIRRCNNRCPFCFVTQMVPRGFRRSLYVKDDDYRYSFLDGNYVTLTNLTEDDWARIAEQRLSPLYVSVHATELGLRRRLLGNPDAPDIVEQLRRLAGLGIVVHTQLVIVPEMNDDQHLEHSVRDLASLWPAVQSVSVIPVGLTKYHRRGLRTNTPSEAVAVLEAVHAWQAGYLSELGERLVYASDEWYLLAGRPVPPYQQYRHLEALEENGVGLVRGFLDGWQVDKGELGRVRHLSLMLVTGTLFAPVLQPVAAEFAQRTGLRVVVRAVVNELFGETITVAGLLTARDVIEQLRHATQDEKVVLPQVMFRGPENRSLDGMTVEEIAATLGRPVGVAASMGDLWELVR